MNAADIMNIALAIALITLAVGQVLSMVRLVIGPTYCVRFLAIDNLVINAVGLVVVLGINLCVKVYFDVALFFYMVGFV